MGWYGREGCSYTYSTAGFSFSYRQEVAAAKVSKTFKKYRHGLLFDRGQPHNTQVVGFLPWWDDIQETEEEDERCPTNCLHAIPNAATQGSSKSFKNF